MGDVTETDFYFVEGQVEGFLLAVQLNAEDTTFDHGRWTELYDGGREW